MSKFFASFVRVYFDRIEPQGGLDTILNTAEDRARSDRDAFAHWYIEGGSPHKQTVLCHVSYEDIAQQRSVLLTRIEKAIESGGMGPETLRVMLRRLRPQDIGFPAIAAANERDSVLTHFQLNLLTEGSGTQIFATSFVEWAARECVRRAEPTTLIVRYAPRIEQLPMNAMIAGKHAVPDPQGSLVDADMGAYYTWLGACRLRGSGDLSFLAWFENQRQAIAIGPGLARGTTSQSVMTMPGLLALLQ